MKEAIYESSTRTVKVPGGILPGTGTALRIPQSGPAYAKEPDGPFLPPPETQAMHSGGSFIECMNDFAA